MKNRLNFKILVAFIVLSLFGCANEPVELVSPSGQAEVITKDSDLYKLISKVASEGDNAAEDIVCIDFVYPVKLLIYDAELTVISSTILNNDEQFSMLLGQLPAEQSISISYPIITQLEDGTTFSVNTNAELKIAIESCSREDLINYYNNLFGGQTGSPTKCVWKIPYDATADNTYASGVFEANSDGTIKFTFHNVVYNGTWNFLFVNDDFHININLEGTSQVASDWNIDRPAIYSGYEIRISNAGGDYVLRQYCETVTVYAIGDQGPSGGIVFYDKGLYSEGWRFMEVSSEDLGNFEWGCSGSDISNASGSAIGSGLYNSAAIVNFHDDLANYYLNPAICNALNNGSVSAQKAILLNQGNFNDWFLPTQGELQLVYQNLQAPGLATFSNISYWTSTQVDADRAKAINFGDGSVVETMKIPAANPVNVRAVRYF